MRFVLVLYAHLDGERPNERAGLMTREVHDHHVQLVSAAAFFLVSAAKAMSLSDSRLISTLASAPSIAARVSALAVVRSDFIFGFVIGFSRSTIPATSLARSATLRGTLVACFRAASMMPSAPAESF